VIDASGSGDGWALSEYLSSSDLPAGSLVDFDGAGSTPGTSVAARLSSFPFSATTPATVCDYGSHCTPASTSSSCTHQSLGFTACASYPVSLAGGTAATAQVDLYSAAAGSGMGAVCLASGSASAIGCSGTTPDADLDLGLPANARTGAYGTTVINVTVSSGP
jgi:hypothetical protein